MAKSTYWEYTWSNTLSVNELNKLGNEGWELIIVYNAGALFKRPRFK